MLFHFNFFTCSIKASAPRSKYGDEPPNEELTLEEKNILNLTRQNTTFNTHAQNLNGNSEAAPLLRLGVDKKVTPIISVRPFGMRNRQCSFLLHPLENYF